MRIIYITWMRHQITSLYKQFAGLATACVILSAVGNAIFADIPNHYKGVTFATASANTGTYRHGTLLDAVRASEDRNQLLVDARLEEDYQRGTISCAINIPVTASFWQIDKYLRNVSRNTSIVVFCQSSKCSYDEFVGSQLSVMGFRDVTVCDEGLLEYTNAGNSIQINTQ